MRRKEEGEEEKEEEGGERERKRERERERKGERGSKSPPLYLSFFISSQTPDHPPLAAILITFAINNKPSMIVFIP